MTPVWLEFERPIIELEQKIDELKIIAQDEKLDVEGEIKQLETKIVHLSNEIYSNLTPWQRVQLARHPNRPYTSDYIKLILTDFIELNGDRCFRNDPSIIAGMGKIDGKSIVFIGQEKGRTTKEKIYRNFGMPHPEGYRKALRIMEMGEKFGKPIVALIDTPGAYPGIGAEERGQAQAIAKNIMAMCTLKTPIIVIVIGEGGSGGALGIGVGDIVLMQEYAFYSVISPEGCASILWKDSKKAEEAAKSLRLTTQDLLEFKVIDGIIPEPKGGAHRNFSEAANMLKQAILTQLNCFSSIELNTLVEKRIKKFQSMGMYKV
ncbi:MAG: acetyl-CoA carboxylase carboxyltransferase subunit alpha [Candidatus Stahlbacteria bacterium]|nr:acetyl-CoA carboxylase carboxyltransferase subunit alpha [Candidatus Stahlbacteria bacterium]